MSKLTSTLKFKKLVIESNTDSTYQVFSYYDNNNNLIKKESLSVGIAPSTTIDDTKTEVFIKQLG